MYSHALSGCSTVFKGLSRVTRPRERAANDRTPLPRAVRAVNPSGPNVYAGFVRVRPVRKASELVRRPVKGEETGHRRQEADRSTSPIIFFSKNENFRPINDLLYRLVVAHASGNFWEGTPFADSIPGSHPVLHFRHAPLLHY